MMLNHSAMVLVLDYVVLIIRYSLKFSQNLINFLVFKPFLQS